MEYDEKTVMSHTISLCLLQAGYGNKANEAIVDSVAEFLKIPLNKQLLLDVLQRRSKTLFSKEEVNFLKPEVIQRAMSIEHMGTVLIDPEGRSLLGTLATDPKTGRTLNEWLYTYAMVLLFYSGVGINAENLKKLLALCNIKTDEGILQTTLQKRSVASSFLNFFNPFKIK